MLLFEVGYQVANGDKFPEWKPGTEFKAKRDEMIKKAAASKTRLEKWWHSSQLSFSGVVAPQGGRFPNRPFFSGAVWKPPLLEAGTKLRARIKFDDPPGELFGSDCLA